MLPITYRPIDLWPGELRHTGERFAMSDLRRVTVARDTLLRDARRRVGS